MTQLRDPAVTGTNVADGRAAAVPATPADAARPGPPLTGAGGPPANGWSPAGILANGWARLLLGLIIPAAVLAAWQLSTAAGVFSVVQLPPPAMVLEAALDLLQRGQLGQHIAISTQRVLIGFTAGAALGLVFGSLVGLSRFADALLAPTIGALRAVPSLAWVPLLILWMKIGEDSKITLILIGAFMAWRRALKNPDLKRRFHTWLLTAPVYGKFERSMNTARFASTLAILVGGGVPLLSALNSGARVMGNVVMSEATEQAIGRVREGASLARALGETRAFPPLLVHLVASGETSGKLERMLERAAQLETRALERRLAVFLTLLEPLMILLMGGVVLMIVLAILLPIMQINQLVH